MRARPVPNVNLDLYCCKPVVTVKKYNYAKKNKKMSWDCFGAPKTKCFKNVKKNGSFVFTFWMPWFCSNNKTSKIERMGIAAFIMRVSIKQEDLKSEGRQAHFASWQFQPLHGILAGPTVSCIMDFGPSPSPSLTSLILLSFDPSPPRPLRSSLLLSVADDGVLLLWCVFLFCFGSYGLLFLYNPHVQKLRGSNTEDQISWILTTQRKSHRHHTGWH